MKFYIISFDGCFITKNKNRTYYINSAKEFNNFVEAKNFAENIIADCGHAMYVVREITARQISNYNMLNNNSYLSVCRDETETRVSPLYITGRLSDHTRLYSERELMYG